MPLWLPNGAGQLLGDQLATGKNLITRGDGKVYYVGPTNASDAGNTGEDPLRPFATVGQAVTTAIDNDIIILMDGLVAAFAGNLAMVEGLIFAAGGQSAGKPTVTWGLSAGGISIQAGGDDIEFRNIKFIASTAANAAPRIIVQSPNCLFRGCYFEMNNNDGAGVVRIDTGAHRCRFENCTFVSTATSVATRPTSAIVLNSGASITRLDIIDCTFDAGAFGFDNSDSSTYKKGYALDFTLGTMGRFRGQNITFLRGADLAFGTATPTGHLQASTISGGAFVRNA